MEAAVITIGGPPGSGKTTAAKALAKLLQRRHVSAGEIFRAEAAKQHLSLAEFGRLAEADPSIDHHLDDLMILEAGPHALLEGRIIGELLARRRVAVFRILVTAAEATRVDRLVKRDGGSHDEVLRAMRTREASERERYLRYYGIDLGRLSAELAVDATSPGPQEVIDLIVRNLPAELRPVTVP